MTCQRFLTAMMSTPDAKLANADPQKLAEKYNLVSCERCGKDHGGVKWAEGCLEHWRQRG